MPRLFDPIKINGLLLKNRLVMPPMNTRKATEDGEVTDQHIEHYVTRASSGIGLIIIEHCYISKEGKGSAGQLGIYDDKLITGLKRLVNTIHSEGAKVIVQINHCGAQAPSKITGVQPAGPWNIIPPNWHEIPRPLTIAEVEALVQDFVKATDRAIAAGFDSVEIHGAHGYLLSQFLSPFTNQRRDIYGSSIEGRLLLPLEVVVAVKKRLKQDMPLFYRLGADDLIEGGLSLKEAQLAAQRLERSGVNVIDVSGGIGGTGRDHFSKQGYFIPLAENIKKVVKVPVIGVGNITEANYADSIVRDEKVDMVAFGRIMLTNPEFPRQAAIELGIE
ncbi:MAG: NADH:flavin oxidoreductase [Dehalococcoidales bacterium]|nr:NADH:flavin oxidoreductase [Dehalococcoidales bacterium]